MLNELITANDLNSEIYGFMEHGFVRGLSVVYNGEAYVVRDIYTRTNPGDSGRKGEVRVADIRLAIRKNFYDENIWVFAGELRFCPKGRASILLPT